MNKKPLPPDVIEAAARLVADVTMIIDIAIEYDGKVLEALEETLIVMRENINNRSSVQVITGEHPRELNKIYAQSNLLQQIINCCHARKEQKNIHVQHE